MGHRVQKFNALNTKLMLANLHKKMESLPNSIDILDDVQKLDGSVQNLELLSQEVQVSANNYDKKEEVDKDEFDKFLESAESKKENIIASIDSSIHSIKDKVVAADSVNDDSDWYDFTDALDGMTNVCQ